MHDTPAMSTAGRGEVRLANRLRVARAERDMSQDQLARAAGVSRQTISSIETGQYTPSALLAFRLAEALGTPIERLFWLEGDSR
jgi:DNA-binding XRE family transcriptional regulator